jgi:hypothetical protein
VDSARDPLAQRGVWTRWSGRGSLDCFFATLHTKLLDRQPGQSGFAHRPEADPQSV